MFLISLIGGFLSTILMTIFEFPFWKKWGLEGILEWHENQILISKFLKKDANKINIPGIFFLHFTNGIFGGIGLWVALIIIPQINLIPAHVLGLIYGWFLWTLTLIPIHKPITGLDPLHHPLGKGPIIVSFVGHSLYGIILGSILSFEKM